MTVTAGVSSPRMGLLLALLLCTVPLSGCLVENPFETHEWEPSVRGPEAFLVSSPYPNLTVEIDYVEGRAPSPQSVSHLDTVLNEVVEKERVHFLGPTQIDVPDTSEDKVWTYDEILDLHEEKLSIADDPIGHGHNDTGIIHVLFLNGAIASGQGSSGRGVSIGNIAVVAPDNVTGPDEGAAQETPVAYEQELEEYLLVHEVGHTLGLVNVPLPMQTERLYGGSCECHSDSRESVMSGYGKDWINGISDHFPVSGVLSEVPTTFDEYDKEDIRAFQQAHEDDR